MKVNINLAAICIFFLLKLFTSESFAQSPEGHDITSCATEPVDLHIYNGISDLPISDADEWDIGAVTVANKNDTDGDSWIDGNVLDIEITSVDGKGESDDKDFMRIRINRPLSSLNNEIVTLSVPQGSNFINIWQSRNKKAGKAPLTFKCKDLPKDLFVEATTQSSQIRDIEIRIDYKNQYDKVRATAIWVDCPQSWHTRCPINEPSCDQALDNPPAGQGTLSNLDSPTGLQTTINTVRNSNDGSRYGHGYNGVVVLNGNPKDNHFGGRILFEFSVLPLLSNGEYEALGVEFDCTRRRSVREFSALHGDKPMVTDDEMFPFQLDDANDDQNSNSGDEDNSPNNGRIYSWDSPGVTNVHTGDISKGYAFRSLKLNFEEYVRVNIDNTIPDIGANGLIGSRVSEKIDWHTVLYTKSGSGHILEPDNSSVSYSFPKKGNNFGNGTCSVELLSSPATDGYKLTFNNGKWKLKGSTVEIEVSENPSGKWILTDNNKIKVTMTELNTPFYPGDNFKFSVFKTANSKINETSESLFIGIGDDF